MAAVTRLPNVQVRAADPGEGRAIAGLWRELWDAHEAWGGYAGTRDGRVYEQLAHRFAYGYANPTDFENWLMDPAKTEEYLKSVS